MNTFASQPEDPAQQAQVSSAGAEVGAELQELWARFQGEMIARVDVLDDALIALVEARLDEELRRRAEREAHRLAGSAGTFGRHGASVLARSLEELFEGSAPIDAAAIPAALSQVELLRDEVAAVPSVNRSKGDNRPLVLVVHPDAALAGRIELALEGEGCASLVVESVPSARAALLVGRPAVALVSFGEEVTGVLDLVRELSARAPPVAVLALTNATGFLDRVDAVRAGVRSFLPETLAPSELGAAAVAALEAVEGHGRLLAVDDDPAVLAVLVALFEPAGFAVIGVTEPERFWAALKETAPDLVVLDLDMPAVSGIELCRLLRAEPRWSTLPVVVLTSHVDRNTIEGVFAAGADDFVPKDVVDSELVPRVLNRLDRARMVRNSAETDPLTGLASRKKFEAQWNRLQTMADRFGQPLSFALLDVDNLRDVNSRYGHGVGDAVLRRIGELLSERFRGEDVVARWGGEEIAVALYGMTRADGVRRVTDVLGTVCDEVMVAPGGQTFGVSFSGGISEYKVDGAMFGDLCARADDALCVAKSLGRGRVLAAGQQPETPDDRRQGEVLPIDVVVVEDDDAVAELLMHGLTGNGYRSLRVLDGHAAVELLAGGSRRPARLVLLDISLPGFDGFAVLEQLRREGVLESTRVIVLSARSSEAEILRALEAGAIDHVGKPFSLPVLMQRVRRALGD